VAQEALLLVPVLGHQADGRALRTRPTDMQPGGGGALFKTTRDRVAKDFHPPSPLPHFLEKVDKKDRRKKAAEEGGNGVATSSRVDALLAKADSILDGDKARVRSAALERSVEIHRRRMQELRDYQLSKETPVEPKWKAAADLHADNAPLRSIEDWLGSSGPKLRGRNARELEKHPSCQSYIARQVEAASQYDSETRANMMVKNSKRLRAVEEQLHEIHTKTHHRSEVRGVDSPRGPVKSFPVDEVLSKLTAESLHLIHEKFKAMGGELNVVEFVEVVSAHLPRHEWEDNAGMAGNLCEVYERLDIDGDGVVSWDEMFEFTIEMGRSMNNKASENLDDVILDYKTAHVSDKRGEFAADRTGGVKDCEIERLESLALMDRLAVLEKDSSVIKLYDAETLELTDCLVGHKGPVMRCQHLEGTDYLVSSGTDTCLIFWGAYTNNLRQVLPCRDVFMALVWDMAHHTLYAGSTNGSIQCFRVSDQSSIANTRQIEEIDRFSAHKDVITDMIAVRDLGLLVSASMDSDIKVWDLAGHELKRRLNGHAQGVYLLGYIPSQRYLISSGFDHTCKVWNPMIEEPLFSLSGHNNRISGIHVVLGSNRVITADLDGVAKIWDARNFICSQTVSIERAEPGTVTGMTYVSRLDRIVISCVGMNSGRVHRMFCLDYEHALAPEVAEEGPLVAALVSVTNNTITTASMRTIRVWDACKGLLKKTFQDIAPANITAMCMDSREQRLIVGDEKGQIGVYNCLNGALLKKLDSHAEDVCALSYCPYSKSIVSASWGGRIRVHHDIKPDATKILRQIDGHATAVTCMAYSLKLCTIATSSSAGNVRLWDFQDAKLATNLQAHTTEVTILHWIDEYRVLLTGDFLGNLILWTVPPWREKYKAICRWEYIVKIDDSKSRAQSAVSTLSGTRRHRSANVAQAQPVSMEDQIKLSPDAARDTPTCCAFDPKSHTLFVGGTSGEIVAYDLKAIKGALIEWMGVDESGKKRGNKLPPVAPRVFVRNPREGRTTVPEAKSATQDSLMIDSLIRSSGDVAFDISSSLDWAMDFNTGKLAAPHYEPDIVQRIRSWAAHQDSIKTIQIIQVTCHSFLVSSSDFIQPALGLTFSAPLRPPPPACLMAE
jgi:WD40 repeat protein